MYHIIKKIIETKADDVLKEALYNSLPYSDVIFIENSERYRGKGKTTLIKILSDHLDVPVYTGRTAYGYDKEKMIRKIEELRGLSSYYILMDCVVESKKEGLELIQKIKDIGLVPIGFVDILRNEEETEHIIFLK